MHGDPTDAHDPSPAPEEIEAAEATSEESASPTPESEAAEAGASMNALIRGQLDRIQGASSKPDQADADTDDDSDPDGASASTREGVKPSDGPAPTGRRGAAAEIARLAAENTRLQQALDVAAPKVPDASEEARARAIETEQRYRKLLVKPESDADWTSDDIQFLEGQKQKRSLVPELQQHYDTIVADDLKANRNAYESWVAQFKAHVASDVASANDLPGVDIDALKAAPTFAARDRVIYAAAEARHAPELKALREENAQLKREALGAVRVPLAGGRSAPGRSIDPGSFMNEIIRGGRNASA